MSHQLVFLNGRAMSAEDAAKVDFERTQPAPTVAAKPPVALVRPQATPVAAPIRTVAAPGTLVTPKTLVAQAKARIRALNAEIRRCERELIPERDELVRLVQAAKPTPGNRAKSETSK